MLPIISHKYAYLVATLLFFIPWTFLIIKRKDLRKEIITMGILFAFMSLATAYFWTLDWWKPITITGTRIGIEDFILGIGNGGVAAVMYEWVFKKTLYKSRSKPHNVGTVVLILFSFLIIVTLIYYFRLTSFFACITALIIASAILMFLRRDLLVSSFTNGLLTVALVLPVYYILILFSPGIVDRTYFKDTLSGIRLTGIPIEEIIFYFCFGFFAAPLYEYWQSLRLRNLSNKNNKKHSH